MGMAALGARGELLSGGVGGFGLAFKADALWVGTGDGGRGEPGRPAGGDGGGGRAGHRGAVWRFRTRRRGWRWTCGCGRCWCTRRRSSGAWGGAVFQLQSDAVDQRVLGRVTLRW